MRTTARAILGKILGGYPIAAIMLASPFALLFPSSIPIIAILVIASFPIVLLLVFVSVKVRERAALGDVQREPENSEERERVSPRESREATLKGQVQRLDREISKCRNMGERRLLVKRRSILQNELRRLRWTERESELFRAYQAQRRFKNNDDDSVKIANALRSLSRKRREFRTLLEIVESAEDVLRSEPDSSLKASLVAIERVLKAHYNVVKRSERTEKKSRELVYAHGYIHNVSSDYWITWIVLECLTNGICFDNSLARYCSEDYRFRFRRFLEVAQNREPKIFKKIEERGGGPPALPFQETPRVL